MTSVEQPHQKKRQNPSNEHLGSGIKTESRNESAGSAATDKKELAHPNYLRIAFSKTGKLAKLGKEQFFALSTNQRNGAVIAGFVLLFWPLLGLLMISPWLIFGVILAYSLLFTFPVFVTDLEEAILTETNISQQHGKYVKDFSKNLQLNWVNGAKYAAELGLKAAVVGYDYASKLLVQLFNQAKAQMANASSASSEKPSVQFKDLKNKTEANKAE